MRPKITQKVAGLEFESHAWVKREKKVKCLFSQASEVNVWISSVLTRELWFAALAVRCNHLGRLPEGIHPHRL